MGKGMGSGDWTEAAKQIFEADPGLDKIWISDTINDRPDGITVSYEAENRGPDKSPKLTKHHYPEKR